MLLVSKVKTLFVNMETFLGETMFRRQVDDEVVLDQLFALVSLFTIML